MGQPGKGRADHLELGQWNVACAECGRKRKSSEVRKLPPGVPGSGLYVCFPEHWNARHPQEFVRGIPDRMAAPYSQLQNDVFISDEIITEDSETDFVAPNPLLTETTFQPFLME